MVIEDFGEGITKTEAIKLYCSPQQRRLIEAAARAQGRDVSSWCRLVLVAVSHTGALPAHLAPPRTSGGEGA